MNEISVYKQLISDTDNCLKVLKREIGMKTTCIPFAVKLIEAMKTLGTQTEQEDLAAADTLLSGLQTLAQGGILPEDYDKIDFVKRGKKIVPSARVEAFYRAAARKGYRITDTIIAVPKDDSGTTYFKEHFADGDIIYTLEDKRLNPDRAVTAQRLTDRYFDKFICRLDVHDARSNKRIVMTVCEMSIDDLLAIARTSEQGLYKSYWEKRKNEYGYEKKQKVITDKLNTDAFWVKWTGEMVNKTVIRRALKRIKEVLPELTETIYAFEQDTSSVQENEVRAIEPAVIIPMESEKVDINNLTEAQRADCNEIHQIVKKNPKLIKDKAAEIEAALKDGEDAQTIINDEYAYIANIKAYCPKAWERIRGYFGE